MPNYEIAIGSDKYHGNSTLTYSWKSIVAIGTVVEAPLRDNSVMGIVVSKSSSSPAKKIKPLLACYQKLAVPDSTLNLLKWIHAYYPGNSGASTKLFLPNKVYDPVSIPASTPQQSSPNKLPNLTPEQKMAVKKLTISKQPLALLHGDTGTGKTRVYLEMALRCFNKGESSIILTPEISLSPQLVEEFSAVFPGSVIQLHSKLTRKSRDMAWSKIVSSKSPKIIIGPRSALFVPLKNIGLIVLDESHDDSYKQSQAPFYDARRVAVKLAITTGAKCVFGSATPDIANYSKFIDNDVPIVRMKKPVSGNIVAATGTILKRGDQKQFTKSSVFSDLAIQKIEKSLSLNQQVLVFLNRRGTARAALCDSCGWQSSCPRCDIGLIYHGDLHKMNCHICGYSSQPPTNCQECGSEKLSFKGYGTKSIEQEAKKFFTTAKTMRFDGDNTESERLDQNYKKIKQGGADILIGTQIVSKGLHLPKLSLVIVPFADSGLSLPDFTSEEKSYQLLQQVVGRVGRTNIKTSIIIQAFDPKRASLNFALNNEWEEFYKTQIDERRKFDFPPFTYLLQISVRKKTRQGAKNSMTRLTDKIKSEFPKTTILGPSPRFNEKTNDNYNWHIIIKSPSRTELAKIAKMIPSTYKANLDPTNLL